MITTAYSHISVLSPQSSPRGFRDFTGRKKASDRKIFVDRGSCLVLDVKPRYGNRMSVAELIRHVTALSAREREKLFLAILALDEKSSTSRTRQTKHVKWPDIEARAKKIFHNRVLPNLVLLEREAVECKV